MNMARLKMVHVFMVVVPQIVVTITKNAIVGIEKVMVVL